MTSKHLFRTLVMLLITSCIHQSKISNNGELYLQVDTTGLEKYSYKNKEGEVIIPESKYFNAFTDTIRTIGFVSKEGEGIIAINTNGEELFKVFPFDNGPDYLRDGLFRMVDKKGLIGFADMNGNIAISPRFDNITPFFDGLAAYCEDCHYKAKNNNPKVRGVRIKGAWGFVNKKGDIALEPQFDQVNFFENGRCKVWKNGREYYIDKNGNEID